MSTRKTEETAAEPPLSAAEFFSKKFPSYSKYVTIQMKIHDTLKNKRFYIIELVYLIILHCLTGIIIFFTHFTFLSFFFFTEDTIIQINFTQIIHIFTSFFLVDIC